MKNHSRSSTTLAFFLVVYRHTFQAICPVCGGDTRDLFIYRDLQNASKEEIIVEVERYPWLFLMADEVNLHTCNS